MKTASIFLLFITIITQNYAQKELWGYKGTVLQPPDYVTYSSGKIIKVPLVGNNSIAEIVHTFDPTGVLGKFPQGRLFQASNGKLYGVTGTATDTNFTTGFLFEYDLILRKYNIIAQLNNTNTGVIEPLAGILMGTTNNGNSVYKYNINTGVFTITASIPSFFIPDLGSGTTYYPGAISELFKASDGNLYYTSSISVNDPPGAIGLQPGGIYRYNMNSNTISKVSLFLGTAFSPLPTRFVEGSPGKLYNITSKGYITYNPNTIFQNGYGVLYEFDIYTNSLSIKYEYDYYNLGAQQGQLVRVSDTKILGTTYSYDGNLTDVPYRDGVIYEYDIPSNTVSLKHAINYQTDDFVYNLVGFSNLASDGNYYNASYSCIYRYNPTTNVINRKIVGTGDGFLQEMIEVCRKPSYQEFIPNTYAPEQGTAFTYNIQNTNATTYVWKKGTVVLPTQTTGILNLPSVTANDTGVYTCTMTNECGETVTMPLNINVTNLATETIDNYKTSITLHPNPTKGNINLKFPENRGMKAISYKVTNLLGQVVLENDIAKNNMATSITIDTAGFANGIYQVTLATDKGNWNGKFVKE